MKIDVSKWEPLSYRNSDHEAGVSTSVSRLDILFADDHYVAMLSDRLRMQLALVLAKEGAVFQPAVTKSVIRKMPYAALWSPEFISHIESLCFIASARGKK